MRRALGTSLPKGHALMPSEPLEVVLARHGRPDLPPVLPRITGRELGGWERRYNDAGIAGSPPPPLSLQQLATGCGCIVASDLERARQSAARLAGGRDIVIEPLLREACLPSSLGCPIRLPARSWVVIGRVAWWLGAGAPAETLAATRQRAQRAAESLVALAEQHGTVLVVGHGTFNRFLATRLRRMGWRGPRLLPVPYWSSARFVRAGVTAPPRAGPTDTASP